MKKTIVQAVTNMINCDMDEFWSSEYSRINNFERDQFMLHQSAAETSVLLDKIRMDILTLHPKAKHLYA